MHSINPREVGHERLSSACTSRQARRISPSCGKVCVLKHSPGPKPYKLQRRGYLHFKKHRVFEPLQLPCLLCTYNILSGKVV
ncbi:hypothetical protein Plhal304r1_c042g0121491 [Plasmopara halstedii]